VTEKFSLSDRRSRIGAIDWRAIRSEAFWLIFLASLVIVGVSSWPTPLYAQTLPPSTKLTELEQTKLQLVAEKQKTNAMTADMIRQAFDKIRQEAQNLQKESQALHDSICEAHGIPPASCVVSPDGTSLSRKAEPPPKAEVPSVAN